MQRKSTQKQRNLSVYEQSNNFAKTKCKEQRQCEIIQWYTSNFDQFTSETVSNSHTVNIKLQKHYWERKSKLIDQNYCSRSIRYQQHESNYHKLRQKANLQRDEITIIKNLKNQYQKIISNVNLNHKSLKKLRKIDRLTFSIFIQLKMKHDYFKSYLHQLSENNSNKCYEICNARQTSKHLLLNCRYYKAKQKKLKKKAKLKNTDIILTLFIIKIERIATLKYLKNTWITMRKWLLEMKE